MLRRRAPEGRPRRALPWFHALCLLAAIVGGLFMITRRVHASVPALPVLLQAASAGLRPAAPPVLGRPRTAAVVSVAPSAAAAPVGSAPAPAGSADAKDVKDGYQDPIDSAVVRDDEKDLPSDLSPEAKRALGVGSGAVLFHRDGPYRSPFAHPQFGGPARAHVGFVLNSVRDYDIQKGTFTADFFIALTSDKPMPPVTLSFGNGKEDGTTKLADKPTFKMWRIIGNFNSPVDLRKFPFDEQMLDIELEAENVGVDQLVLEADPDHTSLDAGFFVPGWGIKTLGASVRKHYYPVRFPHDDLYYSRYSFKLGIERFGTSAVFSVYVPALVIVLIALIAMWVPPAEMEVRTNAGAPMLVGAVLFHFSLMQALPATGYLTRADKVMVSVYVCLVLNMLSTWCFFVVDDDKHDLVFRVSRVLVPLLSFFVVAGGMWL